MFGESAITNIRFAIKIVFHLSWSELEQVEESPRTKFVNIQSEKSDLCVILLIYILIYIAYGTNENVSHKNCNFANIWWSSSKISNNYMTQVPWADRICLQIYCYWRHMSNEVVPFNRVLSLEMNNLFIWTTFSNNKLIDITNNIIILLLYHTKFVTESWNKHWLLKTLLLNTWSLIKTSHR